MDKQTLLLKGIPENFIGLNIESFFKIPGISNDYKIIQKIIEKWINTIINDSINYGLFFGPKENMSNGSGKTFWGCYIILKLLENRITARRINMNKIVDLYWENWKIPEQIFQDQVLFIDDFGKGIDNSGEKSKHMDKIILSCLKYRQEKNLKTIIATSVKLEQIGLNKESEELVKDYMFNVPFPDFNIRRIIKNNEKDKFFVDF